MDDSNKKNSPFPSAPPGAHDLGALMRSNPNTIAEIQVFEKQTFKNLSVARDMSGVGSARSVR